MLSLLIGSQSPEALYSMALVTPVIVPLPPAAVGAAKRTVVGGAAFSVATRPALPLSSSFTWPLPVLLTAETVISWAISTVLLVFAVTSIWPTVPWPAMVRVPPAVRVLTVFPSPASFSVVPGWVSALFTLAFSSTVPLAFTVSTTPSGAVRLPPTSSAEAMLSAVFSNGISMFVLPAAKFSTKPPPVKLRLAAALAASTATVPSTFSLGAEAVAVTCSTVPLMVVCSPVVTARVTFSAVLLTVGFTAAAVLRVSFAPSA